MPYTGYVLILLICIITALVAFNKLPSKWNPYLLYFSAAGLVLMTTCAGTHLVGSDIHLEYYYAQLYSGAEVWQPIFAVPQGTSIANNVIAPLLPWPLLWTYKIVFPLMFATTPVLLYYVFQKWLEPTKAYLGAFAFISFTPFFMEVPTIARQMVAETLLVMALYIILKWESKHRLWILPVLGALLPLAHYSIALVALIALGTSFLVCIVLRQGYWKPILLVLAGIIIASAIYFPTAQEGAVLRKVGHLYNAYVPEPLRIANPAFQLPELPEEAEPSEPGARQTVGPDADPSVPEDMQGMSWLERYDTLIAAGLGGDFLQTNAIGKAYRVFQWLFILAIGLGLWRLRRSKSYWPFALGFGLVTAMCIVPGWANILNVTRFFHLSLIVLAAAIAASANSKYLLVLLLLPYFLLTSGLVFEVAKQPNISTVTAPYSVALSDYRMDLGATTTKDDLIVRDYIIEHELFPINSDNYGALLVQETTGPMGPRKDLNIALPKTPRELEGYIFLRSRNTQDGIFNVWKDIGQRNFWTLEDYGVTDANEVIFQSGDAKVVRCK